jgi:methyl-accepting chemotaxis protein
MFHPDFGGDAKRILAALHRSNAIAEYDPAGKVLTANENFCRALGYDLSEIVGKPHAMFVKPGHAEGAAYRELWAKLGRGDPDTIEYESIAKGGKELWIRGSYNPVLNSAGKVLKVVEVATDVTAAKLLAVESAGKLEAISRAQSVIEYSPDAKIVAVNENFTKTSGYTREKAVGMDHRKLVDPAYAESEDYREFWRRLNRGERVVQQVKRKAAGGRDVWIDASYNPIFDLDGRVMKIVNYMNDVSDRVGAVEQIAAGLSRLAQGDLTCRIETQFIPSLDRIRVDFNASLEALERSMLTINGKSDAIRSGTGEISAAADDLSRRTEQQASSLEETAAALEQITTTVKRTAESAKSGRDIVSTAKVDADKSGDVVREAMEAMAGIDKSAKQISQIIGVIDEIAFQTNLLALNAGVEAARAGDAGRGFAVVASEVRALAQRSAEAAKEIKGLISTSSAQVDQGVRLVTETGDALGRIVAKVVEISGIVTEIASSAQEQATGLQQINIAVNQMDQVTQKNAAMVEETTAASHALASEAEELGALIERYKIGSATDDPIRRELKKVAPHAFAGARQSA